MSTQPPSHETPESTWRDPLIGGLEDRQRRFGPLVLALTTILIALNVAYGSPPRALLQLTLDPYIDVQVPDARDTDCRIYIRNRGVTKATQIQVAFQIVPAAQKYSYSALAVGTHIRTAMASAYEAPKGLGRLVVDIPILRPNQQVDIQIKGAAPARVVMLPEEAHAAIGVLERGNWLRRLLACVAAATFLIATFVLVLYHVVTGGAYISGFLRHTYDLTVMQRIRDAIDRKLSSSPGQFLTIDEWDAVVGEHGAKHHEVPERKEGHTRWKSLRVRKIDVPIWEWVYPGLDREADFRWPFKENKGVWTFMPRDAMFTGFSKTDLGGVSIRFVVVLLAVVVIGTACLYEWFFQVLSRFEHPEWAGWVLGVLLVTTLAYFAYQAARAKMSNKKNERSAYSARSNGKDSAAPSPGRPLH